MVKKGLLLLFIVCFAVCLVPAYLYVKQEKCRKIWNIREAAICYSSELGKTVSEFNKVYAEVLEKHKNQDLILKESQKQWERTVDSCQTINCLKTAYTDRTEWFKNEEYNSLIQPKCSLPEIPEECQIYVYSNYSGEEKVDFYIDKRSTTKIEKINVNMPGKCVALFVSAYEPTVWNVYTTPETRLFSVFAGGYYNQMIAGMPEETLTGVNTCFSGYYEKGRIKEALQKLNVWNDKVVILEQSQIGSLGIPGDYVYNKENVEGKKISLELAPDRDGIQQLLDEGKIRGVYDNEIEKLKKAGLKPLSGPGYRMQYAGDMLVSPFPCEDKTKGLDLSCRNFMMLEDFPKLPEGLGGAHSIFLIVPKDLVPPENNGHSTIFSIDVPVKTVKNW